MSSSQCSPVAGSVAVMRAERGSTPMMHMSQPRAVSPATTTDAMSSIAMLLLVATLMSRLGRSTSWCAWIAYRNDKWQAVADFQNVLHQPTVQGVEVHGAVGCASSSSGTADSQTPRPVLLIKVRNTGHWLTRRA